MNPSIQTALNEQANHELAAANAYLAIALWCEGHSYQGFADYFYEQAEEERAHAKRFLQHLLDRGVTPSISASDAPKAEFERLSEIALCAQSLERNNSAGIQRCYELALEVKDYASHPLLLEFINEQVEEESWADTMVELASRAECPGALYALDRHIKKSLASE